VRAVAWYVGNQRGLPPVGFRATLRRWRRQRWGVSHLGGFPPWLAADFVRRAGLRERWAEVHRAAGVDHPRDQVRVLASGTVWQTAFDRHDTSWHRRLCEDRHPLVDVRLVRFLQGLPTLPWCANKLLFRKYLKRVVPAAIYDRPKTPLRGDPWSQLLPTTATSAIMHPDNLSEVAAYVDVQKLSRPPLNSPTEAWRDLRARMLGAWCRERSTGHARNVILAV